MLNYYTVNKIIKACIILSSLLLGPTLSAKDFDIYINDNGETCNIMLDFQSFIGKFGKTETQRERLTRKHLVRATQNVQEGECSLESSLLLSAIMVSKRDSYGQPHWGSVKYLYEYKSDWKKIKELKFKDLTDETLAELLVPVT